MNILFISFSVLILTLTLSVVFSRLVETPQNNGEEVLMEYVVNSSDVFEYQLKLEVMLKVFDQMLSKISIH